MLIFLTLPLFLASILQQTLVLFYQRERERGKSFTNEVKLAGNVLRYGSFSVKPEDWEEDIRKVIEESSNVCVWSELNNDLQPHEDLSWYGCSFLQRHTGAVQLRIRSDAPWVENISNY